MRSKEQIQEQYPELFKGMGWFPGEPYHIHTNLSIAPKQTPCRPILVHLKQIFRQGIENILTARVIDPVHEATPWRNSFILVESTDKSTGKPKLQICLDLTNLNKAIICEPYCFETPEDIAHKLAGATVITVLDCSKGYWHQMLDEESSYLTTFNTKIGQFRFTVLPFRATLAGDVFQWKLDSIFLNLENVMIIADDVMVIGYQEDKWDHYKAFTQLLETAKKNNIKLNFDKIQEVEFFGKTYTTQGCKPSDAKVKAITEMPKSTTLKDLQTFLGMVQYLSKFSPRIAEIAEPLRDLMKKHAPYV